MVLKKILQPIYLGFFCGSLRCNKGAESRVTMYTEGYKQRSSSVRETRKTAGKLNIKFQFNFSTNWEISVGIIS